MYSYPHKTAYRPLQGVSLEEHISLLAGGGHGLYFHVPFCQAKCGYCNLFSVAGQGEREVGRYLDAVERQCGQYAELLSAEGTIFSELVVGGGTPLFLTEKQLERVFRMTDQYFCFSENRQVVIETAPNQTTGEKLALLKRAGVSRVSMGIQSFSDQELRSLRRQHSAAQAREALALLKSYNFPCINVDFIYGIPGQTEESLLDSLKEALRFAPDEIFLYPLYVKRGVGLEREGVVPDGEAAVGQYRCASRFLRGEGFRQDSMRRFVRRDGIRAFSECGFGTSLALGCGGRSYLGRLHFCSPYAVDGGECLARLKEYESTADYTRITNGIFLSEEEIKRRYVIRHLLIRPGLDPDLYRERFHREVAEDFPLIRDWQERGYVELQEHGAEENAGIEGGESENMHREPMERTGGFTARTAKNAQTVRMGKRKYFSLTDEGLALSDYLGPQLISPQVRKAMDEFWGGQA